MEPEISNTELWKAKYFPKGCNSLLPVHRILSRATKFNYIKIEKQLFIDSAFK
jgi:hypothetical protein